MRKLPGLFILMVLCAAPASAQEETVPELTAQEAAVVAAIKAQNQTPQEQAQNVSLPQPPAQPMQAPKPQTEQAEQSGDIALSEQAKQQAWDEQTKTELAEQAQGQTAAQPQTLTAADATQATPAAQPQEAAQAAAATTTAASEETLPELPPLSAPVSTPQDGQEPSKNMEKCLTVAFIDIDEAFNEHPRTQAVKRLIDVKIRSKEHEVQSAKDIIAALEAENNLLSRQLAELKPYYERIVTDQELLPKVPESGDTLELGNILNRLSFAGTEIITTSPLNSPGQLDDLAERIGANKKIIAERNFFIDNYKYQTREEILNLEKEEVKNILQDIYREIKSFAKKRNIGAVVRKDQILYGQNPVNVTKDFISTLKKSRKYRKKK